MKTIHNYEEAVAYLLDIPKFTKKNTMEDTKNFLKGLNLPLNNKKIVHVNTHMDCDFDLIYKSIPILKEKIMPLMEYPLSLSGDFNSYQNGREYNEIVKFIKDSKFEAPDTMDYLTYHDDCPEKHEGHVIDFIFINDKVKAYKYRVCKDKINGNYSSDHFAIYADLEYNA